MKRFLHTFLLFIAAVMPITNPQTYDELKALIEERRQEFQGLYLSADSTRKDSLIKIARAYIFHEITDEMFPQWYGTPWDFNGTTIIPKQGTIACGYFVTTVLQHAGFRIPRVKLAQCASEFMIRRLTQDIRRFHNVPIEEVIAYLKKREDGLYIAGLDSHTGFIYKKGNTLKFVHSNYYEASTGVMAQELDGWNPINDSQYRVIGRILDDEMIRKWIMEEGWE
jgi:hypothetical protein